MSNEEIPALKPDLESYRDTYRDYLLRNKMFFTKERNIILEAVLNRTDHFSVDELLYDMQSEKMRVSRATLYRALSQLVDAGILVEADFGHGHIHYELVGGEPHEHLICNSCGKVVEVSSPDLMAAIIQLAKSEGFKLVSQRTQIFGICGTCTKKDQK